MTNDCKHMTFISKMKIRVTSGWWILLIATQTHLDANFNLSSFDAWLVLSTPALSVHNQAALFSGDFLYLLCVGAQCMISSGGDERIWCSNVTWERAAKSHMFEQIDLTVSCFNQKLCWIDSKTNLVPRTTAASVWRTLLWHKVPD